MSGTANPQGGITRRGFLKATGVAAGAVGLAGAASMTTTGGWLAPAKAVAASDEKTAYTFHQAHCGGHCSLKCTVRDGRVSLIEPSDAWEDDAFSKVCVKGLSEIQHIYSSERLQTPLKRVGPRGKGEFVAISWDEALDTVANTIRSLQSEFGDDCILYSSGGEIEEGYRLPFLCDMMHAQPLFLVGINIGWANGFGPAIGYVTGYGESSNECRDWVNADNVFIFGSNYLESCLMNSNLFFDAKDAGTRFITIDPHFSTTASKSDEWIPIEPGTDGALLLGMATTILDEGLYDEAFMRDSTAFPFLVDVQTGLLLRDHATEADPFEPDRGEDNPFFVWDATSGSPRSYLDAAIDPVLEGEFEINGALYKTVFSLYKENQQPYTVEWASAKCGVPEDDIKRLGRLYASGGPACLGVGWGGNDKYSNSDIAGHAAAMLVGLTGQIGKPGAGMGVYLAGMWNGRPGTMASWPLPEDVFYSSESEMGLYDFPVKDNNVHAIYAAGDSFQQYIANMHKTEEWLETLDFIVVQDVYHSTYVDWADIVLPVCTKFEHEYDVGGVRVGYGHALMQGKVIDPLFESKSDFQIEQELAKRWNMAAYLPDTPEELFTYMLEESDDPNLEGLTMKALKEHHGVLPMKQSDQIYRLYEDGVFDSASGRVHVYYDHLVDFDQQLPNYEDPCEVYAENSLRKQYPLQFSQPRSRFRIHNQFYDADWINQFHGVFVEMNPIDMEKRDLSAGDEVEIFNDRGSCGCPVRPNDSVRPGCVRMNEGAWSKFMSFGNLQYLTNNTMLERGDLLYNGPVIPFNDTLVEIRKA